MSSVTVPGQPRRDGPALPRRHNWPLLVGLLVVLLLLFISLAGPALAPQDPMERHAVFQVGPDLVRPPLPVLRSAEYPLGTDRFGRDLLSRLLYAVRPTIILVTIVAILRLLLGVLLGMIAGWSAGKPGRAVEGLTAGALSVPVLVAALAAIAAIGVDQGLWPFLIGLSITGWADTARLVQEQTRLIRRLPYVEGALALGASGPHVLANHVLRQITPMLGMLFAFEMSGTLLVLAALGFLGYYIGGGVWVEVQDFVAQRTTGMPELGQLLATTWSVYDPWPAVSIGSVIFLAVLGFNLVGEGLRRHSSFEHAGAPPRRARAGRGVGHWVAERTLPTVATWSRGPAATIVLGVVLVLGLGGGIVWWQAQARAEAREQAADAAVAIAIPGGHQWVGDRHDAQGTLSTAVAPLRSPRASWLFRDAAGFAGGPAVAADGTAYVASLGEMLYALHPDGHVLWQSPLPSPAAGTPALSPDGIIYVTDHAGGVSAYGASGDYLWRSQSPSRGAATSGPIVAPDGTIFYSMGDRVQAVSPAGKPLWTSKGLGGYRELPPRLDPTGRLVYFTNQVYAAADGAKQDLALVTASEANYTDPTYFVGADGRNYFRASSNVISWRNGGNGAEVLKSAAWDPSGLTIFLPNDAGVTREQVIWLAYASEFEDLRLVWLDTDGRVLGNAHYPQRDSRVIALDGASNIYICGDASNGLECASFPPGAGAPEWRISLGEGGKVVGGALAGGRMYVATADGLLYAVDGSAPG